ncbi:hypothetical protein K8B33_04515 [Alcanivorax sp. JB21]|uniref:hypothetical protein n=1 Tax=Alcanivorax limicola TaxID=2874102 RepID=UPI001CBAFA0C|nr:hypothetical protein [Alcanivorax limicola]MBZ2188344.1 hypothetical protein [Alcanivorax limicola]
MWTRKPFPIAAVHPFQLPLGLVIWALWFVAVYGGLSVGCAIATPAAEAGSLTWINAVLGLLTLVVTVGLLALARFCLMAARNEPRTERRFIARLAAGVHVIAAVSTLITGLPILVLPPCV